MTIQYPSELEDHINLPNGELLHVRPLRRGDHRPIRELYGTLSPETRYLRFFSPMPVLPDPVLRLISCVDYCRRLALLAELDARDGVQVVALGSFAAIDDNTAEVALVVSDEWQRQGIGIALAARVLLAAEARGFDRFVAHVLRENVAIRRLLNHVGLVMSTKSQQGVSEVCFVRRQRQASVNDSAPGIVEVPAC
jgi:GNAT superfamily N-acetyltransferase